MNEHITPKQFHEADGTADWRFSKTAILSSLHEGHFKPRWDLVRDLTVPTLFVRGRCSEAFTHEEFKKVLDINSKIQGVEIDDAGHWVHFDQPKLFISAVQKFFHENLGFDFSS